jgi:hypothetical protein
MNAEQLPEPPRNNEYARSLLAEHAAVELEFVGDPEHDIVTETEKLLYRHTYPYRHAAKTIGGYAFAFMCNYGRAIVGIPSPELIASAPPIKNRPLD